MGDWERARREKMLSLAKGLEVVEVDGEKKLNVFSLMEVVVQTFSMLASGEDLVGAVGVGGGGIKFALREVRSGEGV